MNKQAKLKEYAKVVHDFLQDEFGIGTSVTIKVNGNLKPLARMKLDKEKPASQTSPVVILNPLVFNADFINELEFKKVLQHEALHYALFMNGEDYWDYSDNFESALASYHLPTTYADAGRLAKTGETTLMLLNSIDDTKVVKIKEYI